MRLSLIRSIVFLWVTAPLAVMVHAAQDEPPLRKAVADFLQLQTQGLPGKTSFTVGAIKGTEQLPACNNLRVGLPQGGRLWGKTNVVVTCQDSSSWTLYVPVKVTVMGDYLVTSRPLKQGQVVDEQDIATLSGDLGELPNGILTDRQLAIGRTMATSVAAGQPLRPDLLRQALVIRQGQTTKVVSKGPGFEVANEGQALNNAAVGQVVRVRLDNGQLVSGVADNEGRVLVGN